jgi:hypothetical protein
MENEALFQHDSKGIAMDEKKNRVMICPNCSGIDKREVLATATSRNVVHDSTPSAAHGSNGLSAQRRNDIIKLFCLHCGHELTRKGGRA